MADGYSRKEEIEKLFAAIKALVGPGEVLYGVAQAALDRYRSLDHAGECRAVDRLGDRLVVAIRRWGAEMNPRQRKGPK